MNQDADERTRYIEITVQSALARVESATASDMKWSLNPYRGCKHGCVYCYARYTHTFLDLDPDKDFSQTVFVKRNLVEALRADLRKPTWRREHVHIGSATDPYQPAEGRYQLTRGALQVLVDQLTPASLVTKNTMARRDADIMAELARVAGFQLMMSITTVDEALARRMEPDVPSPQQRLRVVSDLAQAGVPVAVAVAPILPGVNDSEVQLTALFAAARAHDADIAFHQSFRMYSATRTTLYNYLQTHHPHLVERYRSAYALAQDAPRPYRLALRERIERIRQQTGISYPQRHARPAAPGGQLSLDL